MAPAGFKVAILLATWPSRSYAIHIGEGTNKVGPPSCEQVEQDVNAMAATSDDEEWVGAYRCYNGGDVIVECGHAVHADRGLATCTMAPGGNDLFSELFRRSGDVVGDVVGAVGGAFDAIGGIFGGGEGQDPKKIDPEQRMKTGPSSAEIEEALEELGDESLKQYVQQEWRDLNFFERDVVIGTMKALGGASLVEAGGKAAHETGFLLKLIQALIQGFRRKQARQANEWGRTTWGADRSMARAKYLDLCGWFGGGKRYRR